MVDKTVTISLKIKSCMALTMQLIKPQKKITDITLEVPLPLCNRVCYGDKVLQYYMRKFHFYL